MKTVMIVDDDPFLVSVYKSKFQREGFSVNTASCGSEALETLNSISADAVVLDLQLPGMDGVEVLRKIRADGKMRDTPVVVFSNAFLGNMVENAWNAGATQVLSKTNCTPNELVDVVRRAMTPPPVSRTRGRTPAAVPGPPPVPAVTSTVSATDLRQQFTDSATPLLAGIGQGLQTLLRAKGEGPIRETLKNLSKNVRTMTGAAGAAGLLRIAQMAGALEALFDELHSRPVGITVSTLRTAVRGAQALTLLCSRTEDAHLTLMRLPLVLLVDDDPIGRRTLEAALDKVGVRAISLGDPAVALAVLMGNPFDLVLLDVEMPEISGFDICKRMRATPLHQDTPVIFVTALENFDELARDQLPEKGEVIAKPFPLIELGVKALTCLLSLPTGSKKLEMRKTESPVLAVA